MRTIQSILIEAEKDRQSVFIEAVRTIQSILIETAEDRRTDGQTDRGNKARTTTQTQVLTRVEGLATHSMSVMSSQSPVTVAEVGLTLLLVVVVQSMLLPPPPPPPGLLTWW